MPTVFAELVLLLSSYAPLLVVFGLLGSFGKGITSLVFYALAALSVVGLIVFMHATGSLQPSTLEVKSAMNRDGDTIAYVMTYLVPFVSLNTNGWRTRVAILVFFAVIAILYLRSHLFYVNPLLGISGYRLFQIETQSGKILILISRRKYVSPGAHVRARTLTDYVFIEAGSDEQSAA